MAHNETGCTTALYCRASAGKAEDNPLESGAAGQQPPDAATVAEAALTLAAVVGPQIGKAWHLDRTRHHVH